MNKQEEELIELLKSERTRIKEILKNIESLLKLMENRVDITEYPTNNSISNKIQYILALGNKLTAKEVASFIISKENIKDKDKIRLINNSVTMIASNLYKDNIIKAEKISVRNYYYINEK